MRSALATVPGTYEAIIDVDRDEAYVSYDATLGDPEAVSAPMITAIRGTGFRPWLKGPGWPERIADDAIGGVLP